MNKQFIFKYDNLKNWDNIQSRLDYRIQIAKFCCKSGTPWSEDSPDFQVEIKPLNLRSKNALKAYWVLIGSIVKWDADNNGYKQGMWDEWFKMEAGLTEEIDLMPLWQMKYKDGKYFDETICDCPVEFKCNCPKDWSFRSTGYIDTMYQGKPRGYYVDLGNQYVEKTRSISNKGDVTKEEMERLINCVLKFGAENNVPNCKIINTELDKLLEFYD